MNKALLLLLFVIVLGCGTTKKVQLTPVVVTATDSIKNYHFVLDSLHAHLFQYTYLQLKAKITLTDSEGTKNSFSATIRMKHDSAIWASLGIAGIEGARLLLTTDSIFIVDRVNKQLMKNDFAFVQHFAGLPLTFSDLENLLIGAPVMLNLQQSVVSKVDSQFVVEDNSSTIKNTIRLNADYTLLTMMISDVSNQRNMISTFTEYDSSAAKPFSMARSIIISHPQTTSVDITFSKIKIDEPLQFPFNTSEKFE